MRSDPPPMKLTSFSNPMSPPSEFLPAEEGRNWTRHIFIPAYFWKRNDQNEKFGLSPVCIFLQK